VVEDDCVDEAGKIVGSDEIDESRQADFNLSIGTTSS